MLLQAAKELQAYMLASFIVCVWPLSWVRGIVESDVGMHVLRGAKVLLSGTLLIAAILILAAIYEAATIILLH